MLLRREATQVRAAATDDLEAVLGLLEANALPTAGVAEHLGGFILESDGETIIGCAGLEAHGQAGLLRSVAVAADRRSRGLGSRLTNGVIEMARARGLTSLSLLTTSPEAYFARFGFERVERRDLPSGLRASAEFQGACPDQAVAMTLSLGS